MRLVFLLFLFTLSSFAQFPWSKGKESSGTGRFIPSFGQSKGKGKRFFKLEFDSGYYQTDFSENRSDNDSYTTKFVQRGIKYNTKAEFFIVPGWLSAGGSFSSTSPRNASVEEQSSLITEACCEIEELETRAYGVLYLPTRPLNLSLMAEYFVSKVRTNDANFGTEEKSGWQYGGMIDVTAQNGATLFAKFFPINSLGEDEDRQEVSAGVHFVLGSSRPASYPYSFFRPGLILKFEFSQITQYVNRGEANQLKSQRNQGYIGLGFRF